MPYATASEYHGPGADLLGTATRKLQLIIFDVRGGGRSGGTLAECVEPLPPGAHEPDQQVRRRAQTPRYAAYGLRYWYAPTFDCTPLYAGDEWDLAQLDWLVAQLMPRHRNADDCGREAADLPGARVWDFNCPPTPWVDFLPTFRDCTYVAFERSGHYPFYEEPELFDTALLEWLETPRPQTRRKRRDPWTTRYRDLNGHPRGLAAAGRGGRPAGSPLRSRSTADRVTDDQR